MNARIAVAGSVVLVLALQITAAIWWIPQKWQACQTLYANRPAQVLCLLTAT